MSNFACVCGVSVIISQEEKPILAVNDEISPALLERPKTPLEQIKSGVYSLGDRTQKAGTFGTSFSTLKLIGLCLGDEICSSLLETHFLVV